MTLAHRENAPVRHTDDVIMSALGQYLRTYGNGSSVLVCPVEPYEGSDKVVASLAKRSAAPLFVTDLAGHEQWVEPANEAPEDDDARHTYFAFHTSGSTGSPSAVVYRKETTRAHARAIAEFLKLDPSMTYVALPPPRFAYGISIVNSHFEADVPVTFTNAEWTLPGLADVLEQSPESPLAVYALPQHIPVLMSAEFDPARLARVLIAGGRISGTAVARLAERYPHVRLTNMYGQAEMGPRLSLWDGAPADFVEGTIGRPLPGVSLSVDGVHGEPGLLKAASPYAMSHVMRAPYERWGDGPGTGDIITNDLAVVTADGEIRHEGRADHVLNVAGTKVDLRRLGQIVEEAASPLAYKVVSKPGTVSGDQRPVVEIVPSAGTPERTGPIRKALAQEFGRLAGLFDIKFVRELTLKESGK